MTLSFSTAINGKPNYFIEKIITGFYLNQIIPISLACELFRDYPLLVDERLRFIDTYRETVNEINPKLHTIREDKNNRWGSGCDIHLVIKNLRFDRFQFAPVIKCKSVQEINIYVSGDVKDFTVAYLVVIDGMDFYDSGLGVDRGMHELAVNEGFETIEDFFAYFNKDFTGKLINWTDLKY